MSVATANGQTHARTLGTRARAAASTATIDKYHDRGAAALNWFFRNRDVRTARERRAVDHGVGGTFGMLVKGAVLLAIGVFVVGAVLGALTLEEGDEETDPDPLYDSMQEVESLTGQAFEIAPIVLIVIVAVLILSFVRDM